ncbi:hypothetical protein [Fusibacter sp. 3D3]|uniref:hypothetical protein n=1 Tax=Fusibacter sp. 3D3 TaxID=1048380 RepID=UPI000852EE2A|nr:hypothetical protein [Fusibacter sp. 3D3]GAU77031.1 hypothetical protein F3D3_1630 [Fusibacter sp. 3D3]
MLKLLKFEFTRKKTVFLVACLMVILGEAYALFKYYQMDESMRYFANNEIFGIFVAFLTFGFGMLYLVDIITLLRQDMFKQEGYMLFMTPFNGYQILGSKVIFALCEGFFIGLIYLAIVVANGKIMGVTDFGFIYEFGNLDANEIWMVIKGILVGILSIVEFALTIFLSFALFKSIFTDVRFKGAITFGIFIGIILIKGQVLNLVTSLVGNSMDLFNASISHVNYVSNIHMALNISMGYVLVMSALLFAMTGYLLEHKINL